MIIQSNESLVRVPMMQWACESKRASANIERCHYPTFKYLDKTQDVHAIVSHTNFKNGIWTIISWERSLSYSHYILIFSLYCFDFYTKIYIFL